jgi:hypothetical protein
MKRSGCSYDDSEPGQTPPPHNQLRSELILGNLVILCMGAISGSVGASSVFPINLLVSSGEKNEC